jgi:hypothetical protein
LILHSALYRGISLGLVLVDWQNLRSSLAVARHRAGPVWVLHALVDAIRGNLPRELAGRTIEVRLFLQPAAEYRADRVLLESCFPPGSGVAVKVQVFHGDMARIALALDASDAWHSGRRDIIVVSDAKDLAFVARRYIDQDARSAISLLHLHSRKRGPHGRVTAAGDEPGIVRRIAVAIDPPEACRAWTWWDHAAWALRRLAAWTDDSIARRSLLAGQDESHADLWRRADYEAVDLVGLERVDHLVADLWRMSWGSPFERGRAEKEAASRLQAAPDEARAAVEALLAAQLLRLHDARRLEVPPSWREGLLLPARRVILRLACQPQHTYPVAKLERQHRYRFIVARPPAIVSRELERRSRDDSWSWVEHALAGPLRAVVRQPEGRWKLLDSKFTRPTVETARRTWVMLESPLGPDEAAARLEEDHVLRPGRWLRCLRDVGIVGKQGGAWVRGRHEPLFR